MVTITATPEPNYSAVRVEITADDGDELILGVFRSVNGTGGDAVRTQVDQLPATFPLVLRDYEAPFGADVRYTLNYQSETEPLAIELSNIVTLQPAAGVSVVLTVVGQPAIQAQLPLELTFNASNRPEVTLHYPIGDTHPRYVLGPVRAREGSMTALVRGYAVQPILDVYNARQPVLLRQAAYAGLDLYHVATDVRHRPATASGSVWFVEVDFAEIAYPTMPLVGAVGWTYLELRNAHDTYAEVAATYPTYADLFIGPLS